MLSFSRARKARRSHRFRPVPRRVRRLRDRRMLTRGGTIRLQIQSNFAMLDVVQSITDRLAEIGGLDEDAVHWIGVAVRESVINAIKHGNREDALKLVTVEFTFTPETAPEELVVRVLDQGEG